MYSRNTAPTDQVAAKPKISSPWVRDMLNRYATSWTIATFAVVGVSGTLIFFHIGSGYLMGVHEWVGMAFVATVVLHVLRHNKLFMVALAKKPTRWAAGIAALVTFGFIAVSALSPREGNPMKRFVDVAAQAPISAVAQVAGLSPAQLSARFEQAGLSGVQADHSLATIASTNGVERRTLFRIVVSTE